MGVVPARCGRATRFLRGFAVKPHTCSVLIGSGLVACAMAAHVFAIVGQEAVASRAPTRPALFTEAQVKTGEAAYGRTCAACHGRTLAGGLAPPLSGAGFARSWRTPGVTLDDLFFVMRTTMPPRQSNALTADERAAVFAYILSYNGYPAGPSPLSSNAAQ